MPKFLVFLAILSILIVIHEFGHFICAKRMGVRVDVFSLGFGPRLFSFRRKETEYALCLFPLGGYVKLAGDTIDEYKGYPYEYLAQPIWKRFGIVFCGPLLNYLLGIVCFCFVFMIGFPRLTTTIGGVLDGFGAKEAGIQENDIIRSIDGEKVLYWDELQKIVQSKKKVSSVRVRLERDGKDMELTVTLKENLVEDVLGQKHAGLGVKPKEGSIVFSRYPFFESFLLGIGKTWELTVITYKALWRMVSGQLSFRDSVSGPLGIYYITAKAAEIGFVALIQLIASLSVSLCIFNLLPIPALDGSHMLLLGIEKIRGKVISKKTEMIFSQVGIGLITLLAVFVFYNDLIKFGVFEKLSNWFGK